MKLKKMNVLSLFDGMSCGQQALERCGIVVDNYFASEIDKYAIQVTMHNYPNTKQLGSVVNVDGYSLPKIGFLMGGSPCQSFSFAGKRKGMATKCEIEIFTLEHYLELKKENYEFEGQSYLFWEFMRLLNEVKPKYFLLENVMMGEKWEKILSKAIGVNAIEINSALVSAQNRKRLYWTNIGLEPGGLFGDLESIIKKPKNKGILLKDILENDVAEKFYLSEKMLSYFKSRATNFNNGKVNVREENGKATTLIASMASCDISDNFIKVYTNLNKAKNKDKANCFTAGGNSGGLHSNMTLLIHNTMPRSSKTNKGGTETLSRTDGKTYFLDTSNTNAIEFIVASRGRNPNNLKSREIGLETEQMLEPRFDGKINCITSVQKDNLVIQLNPSKESGGTQPYMQNRVYDINGINPCLTTLWNGANLINTNRIRRLTPLECERLQTVKDNYTNVVSDSQRYRMLGNGWTVDVITHILSHILL